MRATLKILAIVVAVALVGGTGELLANCQDPGGSYPVRQCLTAAGSPAWFAAPPASAGPVTATWWAVGFGNRPVVDPNGGAQNDPIDGDGFLNGPVTAHVGLFIGNDSGALTSGPANGQPNGGLDLIAAPPVSNGGLCFSFGASWGLPFVDGCGDANRKYSSLGGASDASDNYLNPYWYGSPGLLSDYSLVDPPMGVLLTEATGKHFAIAFFSSTSRNQDPGDIFERGYDMGQIVNGDDNPAAPAGNDNIVPWQTVPDPNVSAVVDPNTQNRIVSLSWGHIRVINDGSVRPNASATADGSGRHVLGNAAGGGVIGGVGVMDQSELVSYQAQSKPIVGVDCDPNAPWSDAGSAVTPALSTSAGAPLSTVVTVPPNSCLRLTTRFGRIPTQALRTTPVSGPTKNANRLDAQAGNMGDIGYEVSSATRKIGEAFLSEKAVLRSATFAQRNLVVVFETLGEFGAQSFNVVAKDRKGNTFVVATVECTQCSSGIGAEYRVEVPGTAIRNAKSITVVMQPSGAVSNEIEISHGPAQTPGRDPKRTNR